jgi:hypothetical protein
MQLYSKLLDAKKKLHAMVAVVAALHSNDTSCEDLVVSIQEAVAQKVDLPDLVSEILVARSCALAVKDDDSGGSMLLLLDPGGMSQFGVRALKDISALASVQSTQIAKVINERLMTSNSAGNPDAQVGAVTSLVIFIEKMQGVGFLSSLAELQVELGRLLILFKTALAGDVVDLAAADVLSQAKAAMDSNRSGTFWKALTLFPAGQFVMTVCGQVELAVLADKGFSIDIKNMMEQCSSLKAVTASTCLKAGEIVIPMQAGLGKSVRHLLALPLCSALLRLTYYI